MIRLAVLSDSAELAMEITTACARLRGVQLNGVFQIEEWREITEEADFDGVLIDAPREQSCQLIGQFAQAGKHILLKGEPGTSATQAEEIISRCRDAGVKLMLLGTARYRPSISAVKQALDSGKLGAAALVRSHCWLSRDVPDEAWRGYLMEQLDLVVWLSGDLPESIFAVGGDAPAKSIQIHLGFPGARMGLLVLAGSLPPGNSYLSCSVIGTTGAAYADDHEQMQLVYRREGPQALKTTEGILTRVAELREFVAAIRENRPAAVSGSEGLRGIVLAEAVRQSLALQQPVKLEGGRYVPTV